MEKWHLYSIDKVLEMLKVDRYKGLSDDVVIERRKEYGDNAISFNEKEKKKILNIKGYLLRMDSFIICILSIILGCLGEFLYAGSIVLIWCINITYKLYLRNNKNEVNIDNMNISNVRVIRGGIRKNVEVRDVVVGDIIDINQGEVVPADIRILEGEDIKVNEKNLVGEDLVSEKYENKMQKDTPHIGEIKNMLYRGSVVVSGSARGIVVAVGNNTEFGKLFITFTNDTKRNMNLEKEIDNNIGKLAIIWLLFSAFSIVILTVLGINIKDTIICAVIPFTCIFAFPIIGIGFNIKKILEDYNIFLINPSILLSAKETEVLVFDKSGNVCSENVNLEKIYIDGNSYEVDETISGNVDIEKIFSIGLLCNNSKFNSNNDTSIGDPMEVAILRVAANNKIYKSIIDSRNERMFEIPLEWDNRIMTTLNKCNKGYKANCKGTVDRTLELSINMYKDGILKEITVEDMEEIKKVDLELSKQGYLTLALAYRNFNYLPSKSENITNNLTFVGILAFSNIIESETKRAIDNLEYLGIKPIMICDDNKIAAFCLANEVGVVKDISEVMSGVEISSLTDEELDSVLNKVKVFTRISPAIKNRVIEGLKRQGKNIALSGEEFADLSLFNTTTCAITTEKSYDLMKQISDITISGNMIKGFINLLYYGEEFKGKLNGLFDFIYTYILGQMVYVATNIYINGENNFSGIIFLNSVVLALILISINNGGGLINYQTNKVKGTFNGIIIGVLCALVNLINSNYKIIIFMILFVILNMTFYLFNCKDERESNIYYY